MDKDKITKLLVIALAALPVAWTFTRRVGETELLGFLGAWLGAYALVILFGVGVGVFYGWIRPHVFPFEYRAQKTGETPDLQAQQAVWDAMFGAVIAVGIYSALQNLFP